MKISQPNLACTTLPSVTPNLLLYCRKFYTIDQNGTHNKNSLKI